MQTANGVVRAAKARIRNCACRALSCVMSRRPSCRPGALNITLLGMSFLKRLKSFEMNGNTLVLKQ